MSGRGNEQFKKGRLNALIKSSGLAVENAATKSPKQQERRGFEPVGRKKDRGMDLTPTHALAPGRSLRINAFVKY